MAVLFDCIDFDRLLRAITGCSSASPLGFLFDFRIFFLQELLGFFAEFNRISLVFVLLLKKLAGFGFVHVVVTGFYLVLLGFDSFISLLLGFT